VAADVRRAVSVEGYLRRSLGVQCHLPAKSVGLHLTSVWWQVNLCEAWKVRLKAQLPSSHLQRHPYSSSMFPANPHALCTATPYSAGNPAMPSRSRFWRHSCSALGRRCGNRSGPVPHARNEGLGLRCSVSRPMSAINIPHYRKAGITHLALEIDGSGASQIALVVSLLHRRRRRLSQIHIGRIYAMCTTIPLVAGCMAICEVSGRGWC
jgi:hypothetical protein